MIKELTINFLIALSFVLAVHGCTTSKNVVKTDVRIDSTKVQELSDSIRYLMNENHKLSTTISELTYGGIVFDTLHIHDTITNTVIVRPDGTIEANGRIKELKFSVSRQKQIIENLTRMVDSLKVLKEKVKTETKYVSVTKDKTKKTTMFPWYLLVIAAATGLVFYLLKNSRG